MYTNIYACMHTCIYIHAWWIYISLYLYMYTNRLYNLVVTTSEFN